jgi:hypothetical protein
MKLILRKHVLFAPEGKSLLAEFISASVGMNNIVTFMEQAIS